MTAAGATRPVDEPRLLTVVEYLAVGEVPSGYAELTEGRVEYVPSPSSITTSHAPSSAIN